MSIKCLFLKNLRHTTVKLNKAIMGKWFCFFRVLETHMRTLKVECRSECIEMEEFHQGSSPLIPVVRVLAVHKYQFSTRWNISWIIWEIHIVL